MSLGHGRESYNNFIMKQLASPVSASGCDLFQLCLQAAQSEGRWDSQETLNVLRMITVKSLCDI